MKTKLGEAISQLVPPAVRDEVRDNVDAVVRSNLADMNLVTREEFEICQKVLQKTRHRLGELEQQVAALEKIHAEATHSEKTDNTE